MSLYQFLWLATGGLMGLAAYLLFEIGRNTFEIAEEHRVKTIPKFNADLSRSDINYSDLRERINETTDTPEVLYPFYLKPEFCQTLTYQEMWIPKKLLYNHEILYFINLFQCPSAFFQFNSFNYFNVPWLRLLEQVCMFWAAVTAGTFGLSDMEVCVATVEAFQNLDPLMKYFLIQTAKQVKSAVEAHYLEKGTPINLQIMSRAYQTAVLIISKLTKEPEVRLNITIEVDEGTLDF